MYGDELVQAFASSRRSGTRTIALIPARRSTPSRSIPTFVSASPTTRAARDLVSLSRRPRLLRPCDHALRRSRQVPSPAGRRRGDVPLLPRNRRGEALHPRPGAPAARDDSRRSHRATAGTATRWKTRCRCVSRARAARPIARSESMSRPGRPSSGPTTTGTGGGRAPPIRWAWSIAGPALVPLRRRSRTRRDDGAGQMGRGHPPRARLPQFASQSFRGWYRQCRSGGHGRQRVLLWPDTFNDHFRPRTLIAATQLLERGGFEVALPREPLCCGRPLYDWGFLDQARQRFERILAVLRANRGWNARARRRARLRVGVQGRAAQLDARRAEANRLSAQVHYFADFVVDHIDRFPNCCAAGRRWCKPIAITMRSSASMPRGNSSSTTRLIDRTPGAGVLRNGRCVRDGPGNVRRWSDDRRTCAPASSSPNSIRTRRSSSRTDSAAASRSRPNGGRGTIHIAQLLRERMI